MQIGGPTIFSLPLAALRLCWIGRTSFACPRQKGLVTRRAHSHIPGGDTLYLPLTLPPVMRFLETACARLGWERNAPEMDHARLAALFTCAVRVAEDQHRGVPTVSVEALVSNLGG